MRNIKLIALLLMMVTSALAFATPPKYVFYIIGDGLGASQRQVSEYYLQHITKNPKAKLAMNSLPIAGINTTHSNNSLVTDSAAAATALATGYKTNNGTVSISPSGNILPTLAERLKKAGYKIGIISSTRLTHATPAAFSSHVLSRGMENEIAEQFLLKEYDFLAAGGYRHFIPQNHTELKSKREDNKDLVNEFKKKKYSTFIGPNDFLKFKNSKPIRNGKILALPTYSHVPYEVNNKKDAILPMFVEKGIEHLSEDGMPFFMMIEGGRIDHACHAHDAHAAIHETLTLDLALKKVLEFYNKHKEETLIVLVGDHETGGLGLGFAKNYFLKLEELTKAKISLDMIPSSLCKSKVSEIKQFADKYLGLNNLSQKEEKIITRALEACLKDEVSPESYGSYNPIRVAFGHLTSLRANLFWTTFGHTAVQLPLSAIGKDSIKFTGFKDNTQIAKTLANILGVNL